jgi:hypothetical protein
VREKQKFGVFKLVASYDACLDDFIMIGWGKNGSEMELADGFESLERK